MGPPPAGPDWGRLYQTAAAQAGLFTAQQAAEAGYSPQLLRHHVRAGRLTRLRRGIYGLVHFPADEQRELVEVWLWSAQLGVFSHETALALLELSDVLPASLHLTLPLSWKPRRLRVPAGVVRHHADVPAAERSWIGVVPITAPARTLNDCAAAGLSPELLQQGAQQALRRGLAARSELGAVEVALAPFGGIAA